MSNEYVLLVDSRRRRWLAVMFAERGETIRIINARRSTLRQRGDMKGKTRKLIQAGSRSTKSSQSTISAALGQTNMPRALEAGTAVVVIDPDVAAVFPNAGDVNEALRALAGIIQKRRPLPGASSP
jgi:hypothetical protein